MSATRWATSDYAAKCDYCGQGIPSDQPRIRDDEPAPGLPRKRSWHIECYVADGSPGGEPRIPRGAPRGARGERPPSAGSSATATAAHATPSALIVPSAASSADAGVIDYSVTIERTYDAEQALQSTLVRVARLRLMQNEVGPTIQALLNGTQTALPPENGEPDATAPTED